MSSIPQCRSLCIGVALMLALAVMPGEARPLAAIKTYGTLKVGLTGDYAPYSLRDADGAIAGADVTMAQSLAKTLGVRLEIVPTTWKTMQADLQADRFDIAMGGVSVTPDRAAIGAFSVTVMRGKSFRPSGDCEIPIRTIWCAGRRVIACPWKRMIPRRGRLN